MGEREEEFSKARPLPPATNRLKTCSCSGWRDGHPGRGGLPHEINLRRGEAVGLVDEVAEGVLQGQGLGGEGAGGFDGAGVFLGPTLRPDREAGLFRQRPLSRIKRDKLLGPQDEGGGDVDDVERAAAEGCGVTGGKFEFISGRPVPHQWCSASQARPCPHRFLASVGRNRAI